MISRGSMVGASLVWLAGLGLVACGGNTGDDSNGSPGAADTGGASSGGSDSGGRDSGGADSGGADSGGTDSGGTDSGGTDSGGTDSGGTDSGGGDPGGSDSGGSDSGGSGGDETGGAETGGGETGGSENGGATTGGVEIGGAEIGGATTGGMQTGGAGGAGQVTEDELDDCSTDADCIVVPYSHCCGATKRAINAELQPVYEAHPEWQVFDDPATCAVIGACLDDSSVTDAWCSSGTCTLVYPDLCSPIACDLDCPYGLWVATDGCETCSCAPPPDVFDVDYSYDPAHLSLDTSLDQYTGGIDRTRFTFTWTYDDPDSLDEEFTVTATVSLMHDNYPYFGSEITYFVTELSPLEMLTVTWDQSFAGDPVSFAVVDGYFSVRAVGDAIEGGVYLVTTNESGSPTSLTLGTSFIETNPWNS